MLVLLLGDILLHMITVPVLQYVLPGYKCKFFAVNIFGNIYHSSKER